MPYDKNHNASWWFSSSLILYVGLGQFNEALSRLYSLMRKTMCDHVLPFPRSRQQARCLLRWWPRLCLQSLLLETYPKLLLWGGSGESGITIAWSYHYEGWNKRLKENYCLKPIQSYYSGEEAGVWWGLQSLLPETYPKLLLWGTGNRRVWWENSQLLSTLPSHLVCVSVRIWVRPPIFAYFQCPHRASTLLFVRHQDRTDGVNPFWPPNGNLMLVSCLLVCLRQSNYFASSEESSHQGVTLLLQPQSSLVCKTE